MIYLMYVVHTLICLFLIVVVLLQSGKGADLSVFGGGSTQTAFGATGATSLLHKLTVSFFVAFMVTTIVIAMMESGRSKSSVMSDVEATAPVSQEEATEAGDVTSEDGATEAGATAGEATAGDSTEESSESDAAADEGASEDAGTDEGTESGDTPPPSN